MTDLAPNYTGTLVSYLNTIGNFTGFLSPLVTSAILGRTIHSMHTRTKWCQNAPTTIHFLIHIVTIKSENIIIESPQTV